MLQPSPLKKNPSRDLSKKRMQGEVRIFTLMGEATESWIEENLHVPRWLHLPNDHSIEPCKIWWSSFEWSDAVV
jgi:hypothetical protein